MVYDAIYHIPQQARRLSIVNNDSTYLFSPRFSTFTGMFLNSILIDYGH